MLGGISGAINEAAVSGDLNVDVKDGLPHLAGALSLDELDLDPMAVVLFGDSGLASDRWRHMAGGPFSQKSSLPFTADLDLTDGGTCGRPVRHGLRRGADR